MKKALEATLKHRKRVMEQEVFDEIDSFIKDDFLNAQWLAYEPAKEKGIEFRMVINRVSDFLKPVYIAILEQKEFDYSWNCDIGSWNNI
ncbi:hypothetical protein AALA90_16720 [Lachnospiraceae bacterium 38-10]